MTLKTGAHLRRGVAGFLVMGLVVLGFVIAEEWGNFSSQNQRVTALLTATPSAERALLTTFSLPQYDGDEVHFDDLRGDVVMVNFWATWCAPCVAEFPQLQALKTHFADARFEILGVNLGETETAIGDFIDGLDDEINFPILRDMATDATTDSLAEQWKIGALPTTIIADKSGKLAHIYRGARDWSDAQSQALIGALLDEDDAAR